jgi:hypothetical protein
MKYQLQLFYIIHIFQISLNLLEKSEFDKTEIKKHLRNAKLKFLNSTYKNSVNINNRQILKILHLIHFEEALDQNNLNRSNLNTLQLLKSNIHDQTYTIIPNTPVFSNSFTQTWAINLMYNLFKHKK